MDMDRIEMSQRERDVLKVMSPVLSGRRTQAEAGRLLGRSVRQVRRIQRRLEAKGDAGVVHRLRGQRSNAAKAPELQREVLDRYRLDYDDFGPTLAAEKFAGAGLAVSAETLRQWLLAAGLWQRRRRRDRHRARRPRRACFGELVQADGSHHDWLEGRGPWLVLLVMIDDATSKTVARFYEAETTEGYFDLLGRYVRKYGRMVAMYTDKDSIFLNPQKGKPTQFTRALGQLGIEWIPAHSPQAKGRVERFNATAQDRLIKEMRLAGVRSIEQANEVLERVFLPWFNRRCTRQPASANDAHRAILAEQNLKAILALHHQRHVANDYTVRLANQVYQLLPPALPGLRGGKVTVEQRLDGSLHLRFKGCYLKSRRVELGALPPDPRGLTLGSIPAGAGIQKGDAVGTTSPSAVYAAVGRSGRTAAEPYPADSSNECKGKAPWRPAPDHPWRGRLRRTFLNQQ